MVQVSHCTQGDVYPSNIWLDHNGRAVLIDLDSAFRIGGPRYGKVVSGPFIDIHEKVRRASASA